MKPRGYVVWLVHSRTYVGQGGGRVASLHDAALFTSEYEAERAGDTYFYQTPGGSKPEGRQVDPVKLARFTPFDVVD